LWSCPLMDTSPKTMFWGILIPEARLIHKPSLIFIFVHTLMKTYLIWLAYYFLLGCLHFGSSSCLGEWNASAYQAARTWYHPPNSHCKFNFQALGSILTVFPLYKMLLHSLVLNLSFFSVFADYSTAPWCSRNHLWTTSGESLWIGALWYSSSSLQRWKGNGPEMDLSLWSLAIPRNLHWGIISLLFPQSNPFSKSY
jgi:hypothetical protein